MKALLLDPRLFNFLIMALYTASAIRWAYAGKWADCAYWSLALGLVLVVTFGYGR